jgi:xylan 1,4-beta-xylosidase
LPGPLDASRLSDEAGVPGTPNFTGAFVGRCAQDLVGPGALRTSIISCTERSYRAGPFSEAAAVAWA